MTWTAPLLTPGVQPVRRLVIFPHSGAGPGGYRPLVATGLPADTQILGVTLPGRERRMDEPCATDVRQIVHAIAAELHGFQAMPTVLFGHSFGAQLAAALASACPGLCGSVVLSAHTPPADFRAPGRSDALDPATMLATGDTPADVLDDPHLHDWLLHLLSADLDLNRQAAGLLQETELRVPILVLGGAHDPLVDKSALFGWQRHAAAGFRARILPGGHFYFHQEPAAHQVRAELHTLLADTPALAEFTDLR
ncbi:Thioesterase [Actinobacteria bacterium OV450]|nr:Thioesterase [Actinobacteria bacterium OV450]